MRNPGHMPAIAEGKRVVVRLRDGSVRGREPVSTTTPPGWAADGKNGCRWTLTGAPHDILEWELAA